MPLAEWFKRHHNGDVTGVGKAPLRKRFSKYRQARIKRKSGFLGAKVLQKQKMAGMTEQERKAMPVTLMAQPKPG